MMSKLRSVCPSFVVADVGVWDAYVRTEGVKELYEAVKDTVEIKAPLRKQPYGLWEFEVQDPNGYILVFSELRD